MKNSQLKSDIANLKHKINEVEESFVSYSNEIESRETKWKTAEKKIDELLRVNLETCVLNVGGKKYQVSLHTLKSRRGTKFYKQILRGEIKKDSETFYDRDFDYFQIILSFLRTGKLKADNLTDDQKEDLLQEAEFFEINFIIETLRATAAEVEFTKVDLSAPFNYNGEVIGTNNPKDLKDKTLLKGYCANSPATITIQFNREVEFEEVNVGGYNGNSLAWYVGHGRGANIQTSLDNVSWNTVGTIPNEYGHVIINVKVSRSRAKYIRFSHHEYFGIGHLEVKEYVKKK